MDFRASRRFERYLFAIVCPDRLVGAGAWSKYRLERLCVIVLHARQEAAGEKRCQFASRTVAQAYPRTTGSRREGRASCRWRRNHAEFTTRTTPIGARRAVFPGSLCHEVSESALCSAHCSLPIEKRPRIHGLSGSHQCQEKWH